MAEHGPDDAVWDRPGGSGGPLDLDALGVPDPLAQRLRDWHRRYRDLSLTNHEWPSREAYAGWVADGRGPAHELQDALPGVEVRYFEDGDERPVRERRGP